MSDEISYKLAIVGSPSSILLYQGLGVEVFGVTTEEEAREIVSDIALPKLGDGETGDFAVVFVEESYYNSFPADLIERFAKRPLPAVIPVPSPDGGDQPNDRLKQLVEKAVGSDILG